MPAGPAWAAGRYGAWAAALSMLAAFPGMYGIAFPVIAGTVFAPPSIPSANHTKSRRCKAL